MKRLVLFDIDGTILTSNGAAARAFRAALEEAFGGPIPTHGYSFAGRTDPQIARDLLTMAGFHDHAIERGLQAFWPRYTQRLRTELEQVGVTVYPGVYELLDRLDAAGDEAVLGLLTGNVVDGAQLKLQAAGIDFNRFRVSAFGSDHANRRELPAIATARAEQTVGRRFSGKSVVVVGDTPHDIACGAHLDVRTIAVATGTYDHEALAACGPDHLFEDLSDVQQVWDAIFS